MKIKPKKSVMNEKILADVDDGIYELTKTIQKKHGLTWAKARDFTNHSIRFLMK